MGMENGGVTLSRTSKFSSADLLIKDGTNQAYMDLFHIQVSSAKLVGICLNKLFLKSNAYNFVIKKFYKSNSIIIYNRNLYD